MLSLDPENIPPHVAIIPDGNGRWAVARGLPRVAGHQRGVEVVRQTVRSAHRLGIRTLTFYAFSRENWSRPSEEVDAIMALLAQYMREDREELLAEGIRVEAIGRLHELPAAIRDELSELCRRTENNDAMRLCFALSYSGRIEIVDAVRRIARAVEGGLLEPDAIDEKTIQQHLYAPELPNPDLLIRTGDEFRISNFTLWQLSYTELYFTQRFWPDFDEKALIEAVAFYQSRERRFGRTSAQVQGGS